MHSISKGIGDQFSACDLRRRSLPTVYQRGSVINSQREVGEQRGRLSISKGIGDQFSADIKRLLDTAQYIKGDR